MENMDSQHSNSFAKRNDTARDYPLDTTLIQFLENQIRKTPDLLALIYKEDQLTYQQLNDKANQLAHFLIGHGVVADTVVGICTERSIEMVVGILGIVKAGGAYVPFDPEYPDERLSYMMRDSSISILLTQSHLINKVLVDGIQTVCLDTQWHEIEQHNTSIPDVQLSADNLIYMIYTSGSTGNPKGVPNIHRALVNRLLWMQEAYQLTVNDRVLQKTPFSFDVSVWEFFWPLMTGACIVVAEPGGHKDPAYLVETIIRYNITTLHFVPSMLSLFLTEGRVRQITSLRHVFCSGEALPFELTMRFFRKIDTKLHNLYGPTEAAIDVSYWECLRESQKNVVPIGYPIANTKLYILDENLQPVPEGEVGELHIGGVGLARGYWKRPELTAEKFIANPFEHCETSKLYKTGDLARYLSDGSIEYLGRVDFQVKIRGLRIELGEIEAVLMKHESILEATVIASDEALGEKKLLAYLVVEKRKQLSINSLRAFLLKELPDYMVPAAFIFLDKMPLSPNGKVDRKALPKGKLQRPDLEQIFIAPKSALEQAICRIWCDLLNLDRVGINDNFFDLGGNSLLAMMTVVLLEEQEKIALPILKLFQYPSVKMLADFLDSAKAGQDRSKRIVRQQGIASNWKIGSENHDVAIIGMSGRFPGAYDINELWNVLCDGRETVTFFSRDQLGRGLDPEVTNDPNYVCARGIIPDGDKFDAQFFGINPAEAKIMDPQQRVFLELAWAALEDAGYTSECYEGLIGVYGGVGNNYYLSLNASTHPDLLRMVGEFPVMVGNEKDHVALRTAHKLNLTGPAVSVHTACSTAMVAIDNAFFSLNTYQCDMALAGGISLQTPPYSGQLHEPGGVFSSDGHCRPFDAAADGTMFSDSAGIVVMKRLDDALRDRDSIYAVIKSTAVNNDGGQKISYLAPSIEGQKRVVLAALERARISADTISYIEAHGTGTPIGDPIEVEALNQVFRLETQRKQFCGIGSIKSNLGHPTIAAGVTGVIKVALSLKYEKIPPTVHYQKANPQIDFENSPFYVVQKLTDWQRGKNVRRAGVSALGFGGTNGHAILEEAPLHEPSAASRPIQLLVFSAKTTAALERMTENLGNYFLKHDDANIGDAAYTLQSGRASLSHRRFIVCGDTAEAANRLLNFEPGSGGTRLLETKAPEIVFMFPGQGSHYVNMGLNFYQSPFDPIFKETVDCCAEILIPHLQLDLRDILYPDAQHVGWAETTLFDTRFQQPALFVLEYALVKLWESWGVVPDAMIGHSIGEFVCAAVAGVFPLEDVLSLVAARGKMMSELPGGAMLSVRLPVLDVYDLLLSGISIAAINGPSLCVVAGSYDKIDAFQKRLESNNVMTKRLQTSHAFHSDVMDAIVEPFADLVSKVQRSTPKIPCMSTMTGKWVTKDSFIDPKYWGQQLRLPVRFAEVIEKIWEEPDRVLLEVGPRTTTATLARQQIQNRSKQVAISSLSDSADGNNEWKTILGALGRLWQCGVKIDSQKFCKGEKRRKISLPTYPFERTRYWLDPAYDHFKSSTVPLEPRQNVSTIMKGGTPLPLSHAASVHSSEKMSHKIIQILEGISGIELGVDVDDTITFSEMGLDSLFLTQLSFSLKKEFNVKVTFRQLTEEFPNIRDLSNYVDQVVASTIKTSQLSFKEDSSGASIEVPDSSFDVQNLTSQTGDLTKTIHPTIFQKEILNIIKKDGDSASRAYNESVCISLAGDMDVQAMRKAINHLCNRHEALRCAFGDGYDAINISEKIEIDIKFIDHALTSRKNLINEVYSIIKNESSELFDLTRGPLLRSVIIKVTDLHHIVVLTSHLSICDGWSLDVMVYELGLLYSSIVKKEAPALKKAPKFSDYIKKQDLFMVSDSYQKMRTYWLAKLSPSVEPLGFPFRDGQLLAKSYKGNRIDLIIEEELCLKVKKVAARSGCSLFNLLLVSYSLLLHIITKNNKFIIGIPSASQNTDNDEYLVGNCLNYLPILNEINLDLSLQEYIVLVRSNVFDAMENSKFPSAEIAKYFMDQAYEKETPFIQACLNMSPKMELNKLKYFNLVADYEYAPRYFESFDLFVNIVSSSENMLDVQFQYNTDLFSLATVNQWQEVFKNILITICNNTENLVKDYIFDANIMDNILHKFSNKIERLTDRDCVAKMIQSVQILKKTALGQVSVDFDHYAIDESRGVNLLSPPGDTPFFFGNDNQLFGVMHVPRVMSGTKGVLFCYPIAQEYIRSHWAFKLLANFLVQRNIPVFKFDYFGTGDSLGDDRNWDIDIWTSNIIEAGSEFKKRAAVSSISIVALRFGSILAGKAIDMGLDCDKLIMWDPVVSGESYLRSLKEMDSKLIESRKNSFPYPTEKDLDLYPDEILGFSFHSMLQQAITQSDLNLMQLVNCKEIVSICSQENRESQLLVEEKISRTNRAKYLMIPDIGYWQNSTFIDQALLPSNILEKIADIIAED